MTTLFGQSFMIGSLAIPDAFLFLIVLCGFALLYGFVIGRDRAVMVLLSLYLSLAVITNAPLFTLLDQAFHIENNPTLKLFWFLGCFLLIFCALWRSRILRNMARERGAWWEAYVFSVCQIGLAVSITLFLLPASFLGAFPPLLTTIFLSNVGRSIWMLAPIILLIFMGPSNNFDYLEDG